MDRRVARALTGDELQEVLAGIREAETPSDVVIATIIGPYRRLMVDVGTTWEAEEMVDPVEWAIPKDQAVQILDAGTTRLAEVTGDSEASLALMLEWLNRGVGQFEPETADRG